ncbi:amino acid/amide ABC transporter substrate-binding protein, HAAT family [Magnetococcus marinus MC-1]|uniref:Amino acid/amide ABC transporter substrate-binding protein, HAAT family n=1 Tax=Magnetococcus marinus (strain ATCC BAA-1437 / JCM 17883 / MC-1) TaxID=156889 RepID=A0L426_MAGMM|nr:ABC transporter substrate-binding protein [Magnetococcus marinus]ABK42719.1 amino acid/amide ABC transporter substrate-binding protein, HAAT family [Magnetococcus marinus MC-1]
MYRFAKAGWCSLFILLLLYNPAAMAAPLAPYHIYMDADWSGANPSSQAIEWGIRTALDERNNTIAGHPVKIVRANHRGNNRRHLRNQQIFLDDARALLVYSGLHSPPLLANKKFINDHAILTLNPWAAAGPITRSLAPNWIFRLSIDDAVAGQVIVHHALTKRGFKKLVLIAEDTSWGRFNHQNMSKKANEYGMEELPVIWSNWGISKAAAKIILRQAASMGADAVLLVVNPAESITFATAMAELEPQRRRPIQSHWGVSAGSFSQKVGENVLKVLDLEYVQTRFSFLNGMLSEHAKQVLARAMRLFPDAIKTPQHIRPPAGFKHAYDLTRILLAAADQVQLSGDVKQDRLLLHHALEHLQTPVQGLIKTYHMPFSPPKSDTSDDHEALHIHDFTMATFDVLGNVQIQQEP